MTASWTIAVVLAAGILAFAAGRITGYSAGQAAQQAAADKAAIKDLEDMIASSAHLILQANQASNDMRATVSRLVTQQRKSTEELSDVLFKSRDDRLLCRFDADSMRIVRTAREQAAAAAAGGVRGAVPAAASANQ